MDLGMLSSLDGVATMPELRSLGFSARGVQRLAVQGRLVRVRPRIYALPEADPRVVRAARVGGRLAGASAAAIHRAWSPAGERLVVEVAQAADLRDPDDAARPLDRTDPGVRVLWRRGRPQRRVGLSPLPEAAAQVLRSEPTPIAVAVLDSVLRRSPLTMLDLEVAAAGLPATTRRTLRRLDARAESGTESVARCVLEDAGFRVAVQVRVPFSDLDRLDLVVEDRVVVECDSSFHDDPASRARDSARDLALHRSRVRRAATAMEDDPVRPRRADRGCDDADAARRPAPFCRDLTTEGPTRRESAACGFTGHGNATPADRYPEVRDF